jgi:hypothetical protein
LNPRRQRVDVLGGGQLQREAHGLDPIQPPGAVVLGEQQPHLAGADRHGDRSAVALMATVDDESQDVAVPRGAGGQVHHRERGRQLAGVQAAFGAARCFRVHGFLVGVGCRFW